MTYSALGSRELLRTGSSGGDPWLRLMVVRTVVTSLYGFVFSIDGKNTRR